MRLYAGQIIARLLELYEEHQLLVFPAVWKFGNGGITGNNSLLSYRSMEYSLRTLHKLHLHRCQPHPSFSLAYLRRLEKSPPKRHLDHHLVHCLTQAHIRTNCWGLGWRSSSHFSSISRSCKLTILQEQIFSLCDVVSVIFVVSLVLGSNQLKCFVIV